MSNRTQIVCLHEGQQGRSIDPVFINRLLKSLDPTWLRPWPGNSTIRLRDCEGRASLIQRMPSELKACLAAGGNTTLMVWADVDDDMADGNQLREEFWQRAQAAGITRAQFDEVVFAFPQKRLENWIEFLQTGKTDESQKAPRLKPSRQDKEAAIAAKVLAERCRRQTNKPSLPPSLSWSCENWRKLVERMQR